MCKTGVKRTPVTSLACSLSTHGLCISPGMFTYGPGTAARLGSSEGQSEDKELDASVLVAIKL